MALYFFHFFDGQSFTNDDMGVDLPSAERAYVEAAQSAQAMWPELLAARCDPRLCRFRIEDALGRELFELPLSELLDNCQKRAPAPAYASELIRRRLDETHTRVARARADVHSAIDDVRRSLSESSSLLAQIEALRTTPSAN